MGNGSLHRAVALRDGTCSLLMLEVRLVLAQSWIGVVSILGEVEVKLRHRWTLIACLYFVGVLLTNVLTPPQQSYTGLFALIPVLLALEWGPIVVVLGSGNVRAGCRTRLGPSPWGWYPAWVARVACSQAVLRPSAIGERRETSTTNENENPKFSARIRAFVLVTEVAKTSSFSTTTSRWMGA